MRLRDQFEKPLTEDQEEATDQIESFLSDKTNCFILKGYAGTGKTFLIEGLIKYLGKIGRNFTLMAPTGRAAMIIGEITGVQASTIHRGIYNFDELIDDDHTYTMRYGLLENENSIDTVYVIDESSMINNLHSEDEFFVFGSGYLLNDLISYIDFKYKRKSKLLFIGDDAQLPPPRMDHSPVLSSKGLSQAYKTSCREFELTNVVRQQEQSGILKVATSIRNSLLENKFSEFKIDTTADDVKQIQSHGFLDVFLNGVNTFEVHNKIIITHSNQQAHDYNLAVRKELFPNKVDVQKNDLLIITKNNYNYVVDLYNGQFVRVVELAETPEPPAHINFKKRGGESASITLIFRDVTVEVPAISGGTNLVKCKIIDNFLKSDAARLKQDEQQALYVDFKRRFSKYYKDRNIPVPGVKSKEYKDALRKDLYFNALQVKFGYAITCHKAQGGEWDEVYVDLNTSMGSLTSGNFRWVYTAITRSKNKLFLIDLENYSATTEMIVDSIKKLTNISPESIYVPTIKDDEIDNSFQFPFLQLKYNDIMEIFSEDSMKISVEHLSYIERYTFNQNSKKAIIDISYKKTGVNRNLRTQSTNNHDYSNMVKEKLDQTFSNDFIYNPVNPWQIELYERLKPNIEALGIQLTNVVNAEYCDKYYIITNEKCAVIEFYYNKNGRYTKAIPASKGGSDDRKLQELLNKLDVRNSRLEEAGQTE